MSMGDCLLPTFIPGSLDQVAGPDMEKNECLHLNEHDGTSYSI
jgi:hypothetical protein